MLPFLRVLVGVWALVVWGVPAPAAADEPEASAPVIDRVILKKKKPVIDRVILKKKKAPVETPAPVIPPPVPLPVSEPLPLPLPPPLAPPLPAAVAALPNPVGAVLQLAFATGALQGPRLGVGYWLGDAWGVALQTGLQWSRESGPVTTAAGPRRLTVVTYALLPELALSYAPVTRKDLRLILEAGGGAVYAKTSRGDKPVPAYNGFAGPAIQWHVARPFSLQAAERVALVSSPDPIRYDVRLSTQLTLGWWFE